MYCRKCGKNIGEAEMCVFCGYGMDEEMLEALTGEPEKPEPQFPPKEEVKQERVLVGSTWKACSKCGTYADIGRGCPVCGYKEEATVVLQPYLPMRWHKAILTFMLIGAIVNLLGVLGLLMGGTYDEFTGAVFERFPSLETMDTVTAIISVIMGIWGLTVWSRLQGRKANAPALLTATYIFGMVYQLVQAVWLRSIIGPEPVRFERTYTSGMYQYKEWLELSVNYPVVIGSILLMLVYVIVNHIYYKKRAGYFVN